MPVALPEFLSLRSYLPVIDARSEGEFNSGHIPGALNLPLLKNEERVLVGTDYKKLGREAAIMTGFRLVGPRLEKLVEEAGLLTGSRKKALVYCWRGGMRSTYLSNFMRMAGIEATPLAGGYKTYRRAAMEAFATPLPLVVVGGKTGSGKTEILQALARCGEQVIDLEGLANHKGSAFGGLMHGPQPSTEQFQNDLFDAILRADRSRPLWIEDESKAIGKIFLPDPFWQQKKNAPVVEVDLSVEERVNRLVNEYGPANRDEFLASMEKITRKLGGQHFNEARNLLLAGDMHGTIRILLHYYDKNYGESLDKKKEQILDRLTWEDKDMDQLVADMVACSRQHSDRIFRC